MSEYIAAQESRLNTLINYLLNERPESGTNFMPNHYEQKRELYRKLVNVRPPNPVPNEFLKVQDEFLQAEKLHRGIIRMSNLPVCELDSRIALWRGDITTLKVDAIVNAANSGMLGCFAPGHTCIDNAIHTFAGVQLRQACHGLIQKQGHDEPTGTAKITPAFNLPSRYVLHTVGPIVQSELTSKHKDELAACYRSCLSLAAENGLESIAFCCISTGVFGFPKQEAAEIAVRTVKEVLAHCTEIKRIVFNVFTNEDYEIYQDFLM